MLNFSEFKIVSRLTYLKYNKNAQIPFLFNKTTLVHLVGMMSSAYCGQLLTSALAGSLQGFGDGLLSVGCYKPTS